MDELADFSDLSKYLEYMSEGTYQVAALYFLIGKKLFLVVQSTLVVSKSKYSLKYFEISVPRHIRFAELRKK